jgi:hypothetical protein
VGLTGIWTLLEGDTFVTCPEIRYRESKRLLGENMEEIRTIVFNDIETRQEAVVVLRKDKDIVALCISHEGEGDIEIVMPREVTRQLIDALQDAVR